MKHTEVNITSKIRKCIVSINIYRNIEHTHLEDWTFKRTVTAYSSVKQQSNAQASHRYIYLYFQRIHHDNLIWIQCW